MSEVIGLPERRRRQRMRAALLLVLGLLLAVTSAGVAYVVISERIAPTPPPEKPTVAMVVAAEDLPARTALTTANLKVVQIFPEIRPAAAVADPAALVGKITNLPIATNQAVLPSNLGAATGTPFTVLPPGERLGPTSSEWRALSVSIPDANAVGGSIQPGDIIDLIFTLTYERVGVTVIAPAPASGTGTSANIPSERAAKIVFERIPVLARTGAVYTIRLDAQASERMAVLLNSEAQTLALLRAPGDDRATKATGATLSNETQQFLRIPGVVR